MLSPKIYTDLTILKTYAQSISDRLENLMHTDTGENLLEDEILVNMTYVDSMKNTMEAILVEIEEKR